MLRRRSGSRVSGKGSPKVFARDVREALCFALRPHRKGGVPGLSRLLPDRD